MQTTPSQAKRLRRPRRARTPAPPRPHGALLAASCGLLAVLILSACGGSSPGRPSAANAADNALKFSRCMREHGIKDFPDPQVSGGKVTLKFAVKPGAAGRVSPRAMDAAQNACKHFQAAQEPNLTPQEKVAREEAVQKFARCMREHGINVHASSSGGGVQVRVGGGPGSRGPNPESPAFQAAQKACQGLMPDKGAGPGTGSVKGGGPGAGLSLGG
jgi:hypothetical protein